MICQHCGEEFQGQHNAKWCADCRPVVAAERERERRAAGIKVEIVVPDEKRCSRCGETKPASAFSPQVDRPTGLTAYCKECLARYSKEKRKAGAWRMPPKDIHHCIVCGAELDRKRERCQSCQREYSLAQGRKYYREHFVSVAETNPVIEKVCKHCGKTFTMNRWASRCIYCKDCGRKVYKVHGTFNQRARKILRKLYGCIPPLMYEHINRKKVLEKDHWVCRVCGERIDK